MGKKKDPNRRYSHNWGGRRVPKTPAARKAPFPISDDQARLLKRIGGGDGTKGLDLVLNDWRHF